MNPKNSRWMALAAGVLLFLANVYVCRELFLTAYLDQMGSIEGAFISIARYASAHWSDLSWFPLWYNGIPYQNSYPPVLHLMVAAFRSVTGVSAGLAYHAVTATLYCGGAVTLYALAWRLSRNTTVSFFAGAIYSFISASTFLVGDIRHDMGGLFAPRRLRVLLSYGEGPHIAGLTLLPLAILLLDVAIKRRKPWWTGLAALAFALTVLCNWLAAVALAAAVVAYIVANFSKATVWHSALVGLLAYGLAAPWIPPSTIRVIQFNAKTIEGDFTGVYRTLPVYGSVMLIGFVLLWLLLRWLDAEPALRWGAVFAYFMGALALPALWWKIYILPQPARYHVEMELGIAMIVAFLLGAIARRLPVRIATAVWILLALALIYPAKKDRRFARFYLAPVDIEKTVEYRASRWMESNLAGQRVMASGSVSFWMNAFTDTPQFGGGFDQGVTNFMNRVGQYALYSDDGVPDGRFELADLWFKAYGVDAVEVTGPKGREVYHPWQHPEKFADRYPVLWQDGDDLIYRVPRRSASLAHVVATADVATRTPSNGIDTEPLRTYVAGLENPANPTLQFRWTSAHSAEIQGQVPAGKLIAVQVSADPGWYVSRGTVRGDGLGLVVIDPQCSGDCRVTLAWNGGWEMKIARVFAWMSLLAIIGWSVATRFRPRTF